MSTETEIPRINRNDFIDPKKVLAGPYNNIEEAVRAHRKLQEINMGDSLDSLVGDVVIPGMPNLQAKEKPVTSVLREEDEYFP